MTTNDQYQRGLELRKKIFGDAAVEKRTAAVGEFGAPLQRIVNEYAYGDVWQRSATSMQTKSLAMISMMAALNRPNELRVHIQGALANGCNADEIRDILLLVALYCGIPAANDAHRIAREVMDATPAK